MKVDNNPSLVTSAEVEAVMTNCLLSAHLYCYSRIWIRVGTRNSNNSSHSSEVNPAKHKNNTNRPQFTFVKRLWHEKVRTEGSQNSSFSFAISLEGNSISLAISRPVEAKLSVRHGETNTHVH